MLVEATGDAGAELREGFTIDKMLPDDGTVSGIRGCERESATVPERGRSVFGGHGRHSLVAKTAKPWGRAA